MNERFRLMMMMMEEAMTSPWPGATAKDDLTIRNLVDDDESFLFMEPTGQENTVNPLNDDESSSSMSQTLISAFSSSSRQTNDGDYVHRIHYEDSSPEPRFSVLHKGIDKGENKYTLKIKSSGNAVVDDGYKWRKYGQKCIKTNAHPRSYYRCTNPRCSAKKQVERSADEPDTLIVTYEGFHLHFAYPFFLPRPPPPTGGGQPHNNVITNYSSNNPSKKLKKAIMMPHQSHSPEEQQPRTNNSINLLNPETVMSVDPYCSQTSQGLLEDMVPWVIRNPLKNTTATTSASSNSSFSSPTPYSSPSSPPFSPGSLTWSTAPPNRLPWDFDVGT